ncbi:uncharacterized protein LTR77_007958 [Saxophila tyrrhenica]|uniref:Ca3427-like PBP 2 domain-containing protein n=1 Tax=Saxophila tyrrhenica TaxID=1690608 RepID=A0AAV9P1D3_9PEZI|nr:hypothetical protein LTR77_007958 [Saxophila tyrrhenica]
MARLRVGYVPEHFSTPLSFASTHHSLDADLIPEPLGTGALTARLKAPHSDSNAIDVAVGLTEGFVADLGRAKLAGEDTGYKLSGTYVSSPLCWAIVTGAQRAGINGVEDLKGKRVGVSRIGSGSYVMSYVLADQHGWLEQGKEPFEVVVAGDFASLRKSVREEGATPSDFFMWEHFTTRKYWEEGEVKRIGEIYTPWASWMIASRTSAEKEVPGFLEGVNKGVEMFRGKPEQVVKHITGTMHYSEADAREWMKSVEYPDDVRGVAQETVGNTVNILRKSGVLKGDVGNGQAMVHQAR